MKLIFIILAILVLLSPTIYLILKHKKESYSSLSFEGKTVLVTGGTSGIGLATAILFAKNGAKKVFVCGRTPEKWERAKKTISCDNIAYIKCDVRVEEQVKNMIEQIGVIHIAFNNAGVASGVPITKQSIPGSEKDGEISYTIPSKSKDKPCPPGMEDPESGFCENPIYTDGMGTMYCMKYEVESMRRHGIEGSIVNTASVNALWGSPSGAIYSMAKAMVKMLTQSTGAFEVSQKPKIRVNCVSPGPVNTPLIRKQFPPGKNIEEIQRIASTGVPMGRMAEPSEIGQVVMFLADNSKASYVTGAMWVVDGGLTASPVLNPK